jgi:hypothetical protein
MRVGLVRNVGLSITALAVLALGGCNDNPLSFDVKDTVGIQVNPSEMVVAAGRTAELESRAVNQGNEPTFDAVAAAVDPVCGPGSITVVPDPDALEIQPPGLFDVTGGSVLGQTCIVLTSGSNTAQVDVTVVADGVAITAPADGAVFRAGETGQVVAGLTDRDGNAVGPYVAEDAVFTSSDADVADYTDDAGSFSTETAGPATLGVTWAGQAANGTAGLGVVRSDEIAIEVIANVPASAGLDNGDDFGAVAGGETVQAEVLVLDQFGNQNTDETEITACTVLSSDPAVATATCTLDLTNSVNVLVDVTTVAPGGADISGTVTTSEGVFDYGPASIVVLAPSVTGISTPTGFVGTEVTISGAGLAATGFDTEVLIDGASVSGDVAAPGFVVSVTETDVVILMPDLGNANDAFEVGISVGGVVAAETFTYTQLADARQDEPANDNPATATPITFPLDAVGSYEGIDVDDFHLFTTTGPATIVIDLDWDDHSVDLDILVTDEGVTAFVCFDGATGAAPETSVCEIPAAGNYQLWLNNYSGADHPTSYRVKAVVQ